MSDEQTGQPTRRVELASPRTINGTDYPPDAVVTLPAEEARRLVRDGRARWHAEEELDDMDRRVAAQPPASARSSATRAAAGTSRRAAAVKARGAGAENQGE